MDNRAGDPQWADHDAGNAIVNAAQLPVSDDQAARGVQLEQLSRPVDDDRLGGCRDGLGGWVFGGR